MKSSVKIESNHNSTKQIYCLYNKSVYIPIFKHKYRNVCKFLIFWCKICMYIQYINLLDKYWVTKQNIKNDIIVLVKKKNIKHYILVDLFREKTCRFGKNYWGRFGRIILISKKVGAFWKINRSFWYKVEAFW